MLRPFLIPIAVLILSGCSPAQKQVTPVQPLSPPPVVVERPVTSPDSLFNPASADFLFDDNRARRVGDVVLVNIVETSEASNKASTSAEKESSVNLGVDSFFGNKSMYAVPVGQALGVGGGLGPKGEVGSSPMVKASSESDFEGKGETKRESNVTATIAARVVHAYPNGLLQVEGGREVRVNGETQILVIRGLLRARDIGPDNAVTSNYLADSKIEYYGEGILTDKQRPGWLTRVLDNAWPF
ncbi:MAG: flagellar basal body L-ring protein FlgH [Desulfovibrionales bacterium]